MADPENPNSPARPGEPVPVGDLTPSLTRDEALAKLAEEVAASSEHHVVLLEDHRMGIMGLPANREAAGKLAAAGFSFCSEADERLLQHRSSLGVVLGLPPQRQAQRKVVEQLGKASDELVAASKPQASPLRVHNVGDLLVSAKEGLEAARQQLGKPRLRLEELYLEPLRVFIRMRQGDLGKSQEFKSLKRSVEKDHSKLGAPLALFDFITALMNFGSADNIQYFVRRLCETNQLPQSIENTAELTREVKTLAEQTDAYRHTGDADKNTAKNALSALRSRRGLFVVGWAHGIFSDNPASLPDQLAEQTKDKSKASVRVIQLMNAECAAHTYQVMTRYAQEEGQPLRHVMVYDFEKGKKWASVQDWLKEAPAYYGFKPKGPASAPEAPPAPP